MNSKATSLSAELIEVHDIAHETKYFRFRASSDISFSPGQFFLLCLPDGVRRAYSLASAPEELPFFDLVVKHVPHGKASELLWKSSPGMIFEFLGPLGKFGVRFPEKKQIFFATGTGMTPFRSMMRSFSYHQDAPEIFLFFGVRNEHYLCFREEFSAWAFESPEKRQVTFCLSQPKEMADWYRNERVTATAMNLDSHFFENAEISLCGSHEMVKEIRQILENKGVDPETINRESW